jgi:hypothetical protein
MGCCRQSALDILRRKYPTETAMKLRGLLRRLGDYVYRYDCDPSCGE